MVARLAERLKKDGSDLDGWLQLMRSYVVLGERDKALSAAADARQAIGGDQDKRRRFDDFVKIAGVGRLTTGPARPQWKLKNTPA